MLRKISRVVLGTAVAVGLMLSVALAESETVSGKVRSIDTVQGIVIIMTDEEGPRQLAVPRELLKGVKPGHDIDVEIVDGRVQTLQNYSSEN